MQKISKLKFYDEIIYYKKCFTETLITGYCNCHAIKSTFLKIYTFTVGSIIASNAKNRIKDSSLPFSIYIYCHIFPDKEPSQETALEHILVI